MQQHCRPNCNCTNASSGMRHSCGALCAAVLLCSVNAVTAAAAARESQEAAAAATCPLGEYEAHDSAASSPALLQSRHDHAKRDVAEAPLIEEHVAPLGTAMRVGSPSAPLRAWGAAREELWQEPALQLRQDQAVVVVAMAAPAPADSIDADEPESAPPWYITLAVGVGAASCILAFLIFLLAMLQVLVRIQQQYVERLLREQQAKKGEKHSKPDGFLIKQDAGETLDGEEEKLTEQDVMSLVNGDAERLEMLHRLASSPEQKSLVAALVQRGSVANKLRLGEESEGQIARALIAVANIALEMSRKRDKGDRSPRARLQSAFKQVLRMVKVCRAFNLSINDHEERGWTNDAHEDQADKYSEGAAKQSGSKNVKIKTDSAIGAYFASEKWVDHAGIMFIFVYSQICGVIYAFYLKHRFPKMYVFMGPWVLVSRGEAMSMILLTVTMVLLLTRGVMTKARKFCGWSTILENIVDKHTMMHQWCGRFLPLCAAFHILGHLRGSIPAIINEHDNDKINEVFTYGTKIKFNFNSWGGALLCYPAVTGFCLVGILIAFWSLSNEYVRRKYFEMFHYPHMFLVVAWALGLWAHGARQWLGCGVPLGLLVVLPVVCIYVVERLIHIWHSGESQIKIVGATVKKKTVLLEIDTEGSSFTYTTGMYCMLKVPDISDLEWHPFTIASAGGSPVVRVLFAVAGDWTTAMKNLCEGARKTGEYPRICVRGGYGAPAENMKDCKHIVMVGAGVGATPFLSFLASICLAAQKGEKCQYDSIETAVFYWVSREPEDFVWVNQYSSVIAEHASLRDRVSIRLCLTKSLETSATAECSAAEVALFWMGAQVALSFYHARGLAAELGAPTQFGRPDWLKELGTHSQELLAKRPKLSEGELAEKMEVDVFACGNALLVQSLEDACDALDSDDVDFRLFAEQF